MPYAWRTIGKGGNDPEGAEFRIENILVRSV
jgi:hypothetical protein